MFAQLRKACLAVAVGVAATLAVAPLANAAEPSSTAASEAQDCAYHVQTHQTVCVPKGADLEAAWREKTGRGVVDAAANPSARYAMGPQTTTDYKMAIVYDNTNFGGSSLSFYNWNYCTAGGEIYFNYPSSWYGRVSSAQGKSYCRVRVWEQTNMGGASVGYATQIAWVGNALNDKTKSISVTY